MTNNPPTPPVKLETHLGIYGGLEEGIGMRAYYLHGQMNFAKTLKLRFREGDPDLSERRNRSTSSREEECTDVPVWQSNRR